MEHPEAGDLNLSGIPIRLKSTPPRLRQPPPDLGEHSIVIARELRVYPGGNRPIGRERRADQVRLLTGYRMNVP